MLGAGDVVVTTVLGPLPLESLGLTLMHEHIQSSVEHVWEPWLRTRLDEGRMPVIIENLGDLRRDPLGSRENMSLDSEADAIVELAEARAAGVATVVEPTTRDTGRDPAALSRISRATGLNIVMGTGWYLQPEGSSRPGRDVDALAEAMVQEVVEGVDGARCGVIGEIGISAGFSDLDETVLRAAARAQVATKVPLMVHLPGWHRHAERVLDVTESEGVRPEATVLCHMNPSQDDGAYQTSLLDRGAWLGYDMIGMDFYYEHERAQAPCDKENADAVARIVREGYGSKILLSSDVFLKMMLTRYGGNGYAHVVKRFLPMLSERGLSDQEIEQLVTNNPHEVFRQAGV